MARSMYVTLSVEIQCSNIATNANQRLQNGIDYVLCLKKKSTSATATATKSHKKSYPSMWVSFALYGSTQWPTREEEILKKKFVRQLWQFLRVGVFNVILLDFFSFVSQSTHGYRHVVTHRRISID